MMGAASTVSTGAATGAATGACATGGAALAGRTTLAVLRVVADLVDFVAVDLALGASGSLVLVVNGSLGVVTTGALSITVVTGATVTGCTASGAVWARSWVEERARTAAIAVVAGRIFEVLWVITGGQRTPDHNGPCTGVNKNALGFRHPPASSDRSAQVAARERIRQGSRL
jgi:hypothetical protein